MLKKIVFLVSLLMTLVINTYAQDQKPLIFATEATYPPFVSMSSNGQIKGFDAAIIEALCTQMQRNCKLVNAPWDSLIPSLQIGRFDALFGGMGITKAREKVVDFTNPYYENSVTFVIKKGSDFSLNTIKGKTIGVQVGTTFAKYLMMKYGNQITIKTYQSNMTALIDLKASRLDAVFIDKPVAKLWLDKSDNSDYMDKYSITNTTYFGTGNGIAVNKNNPKLVKQLNSALADIKANGTYQKIVHQYFG
ncbi:transporter substrate-binding domain-containing protein [Thiotrichales bacterium 19S3-7]|nr:transporter substrate-binding domain-containing protein [Thiotrichales bacterium 19S3-7]MCF6802643.1 transporter substrate-binding domain-containing protein [Thiotrichales bacterium 19S3-11]